MRKKYWSLAFKEEWEIQSISLKKSEKYKQSLLFFFGILKKFTFNCSIIALQCCVSFCCTATWISCKYTYIRSFLSLLPTPRSAPCTPLGHHRAPSWAPWYVYTMQSYSTNKKEQNWVICTDVDGPRVCHTEWSKSEREIQIWYIKTYMWWSRWNLEKWYWGTHL